MKLYNYLERKYEEGNYLERGYSLNRFMEAWLYSNMANDSMYEGFVDDDYLGLHYKDYEIDHNNRVIDFLISDTDMEDSEAEKINIAISTTKEMMEDILSANLNNKIIELGKELDLDIHSFDEDCVAEICAMPTQKLFNTLNEIMNDNYYGGWCDCLDSINIAMTKEDHIIYVTTWANDSQINDCITIRPNGSFDIVEKIMRSVESTCNAGSCFDHRIEKKYLVIAYNKICENEI